MEDGVPEAESLLHPKEGDDDEKDNHQESGEERPSGSFINHIFSNLMSRGEAEHREEEGKEEENEEKGGGLLDNIIPNLISPLSRKEEQNEAFQVRDVEGTSEDQAKKKQKVTTGVDEANERVKAEEEDGGGIIDHLVPTFLHRFQMMLFQQLTKQPSSFTPSSMIKESELIIIKDLQRGSVT